MNFLTLTYWFSGGSLIPWAQKGLLILLGLFALSIIALYLIKKKHKRGLYYKLLTQIEGFFYGNLAIGALLWFSTYQSARGLSARIWFLLWLVVIIFWMYFIVKTVRSIPELREKLEKEKEFKKYVP